jgi:YVTN family beta-propeller protein
VPAKGNFVRLGVPGCAILLFAAAAVFASGLLYQVVKTYAVAGEGGWDYLTADASARRLYISRSTHVLVLDLDSGKTVGDIADTPGVHGIALAAEQGRGFVSNGGAGTVSIFDLKTLSTSRKVKVGENPEAMLYDSATQRIFAFNGRSQDATAIDAATGTVLATIKLDGRPEFAVSDGQGGVFVNIEDKSELVEVDSNKLKVRAKWPLLPCESPSGLSIDRVNRRLFVGCHNKMMAVVNADTGKVLATPATGGSVGATAFDEQRNLAFASCGEGWLTVVREDSPDRFTIAESVPTQAGARALALDSQTHNVLVATSRSGVLPGSAAEQPHSRSTNSPGSLVLLVVAAQPNPAENCPLDCVLRKMDESAADFQTAKADFVWDQYQKVVDETFTQKGTVYYRREGKAIEMMAEIKQPDTISLLYRDGKLQMYRPKIEQVMEYPTGNNRTEIESYLVLGFGGSGQDLTKSFEVSYLGEEAVGGLRSAKLQLIPKNEKVRNNFSKILLWIDLSNAISVQQQFFLPEGDSRTAKYFSVQLKGKIGNDVFRLKTTSKTQFISPRG